MKIPFKKYFFVLILVLVIFPSTALAVALQPPGEFPITEPLRPANPGSKPNYSTNVQDDTKTPSNVVSSGEKAEQGASNEIVGADGQPIAETPVAQVTTVENKGSKKWVLLLVAAIVIAIAGGLYWRKKITQAQASLVVIGLIFSVFGLMGTVRFAQAQVPPTNTPVIQRTIEETDPAGDPIPNEPTAQSKASKQVLFGLGAILLIIIAMGGMTAFWRSNHKSSLPSAPPTPPQ